MCMLAVAFFFYSCLAHIQLNNTFTPFLQRMFPISLCFKINSFQFTLEFALQFIFYRSDKHKVSPLYHYSIIILLSGKILCAPPSPSVPQSLMPFHLHGFAIFQNVIELASYHSWTACSFSRLASFSFFVNFHVFQWFCIILS